MLHARYLVIAVCVALTSSTSGLAEEASAFSLPIGVSPTVVIDALIERGWQQAAVVPSDGCDDATFLRRVSLDLIGRVPTVEERTKFLADTRSDKRQRIVDALIEHQEFAVHFADLFDGMLLGRRGTRADERRKQHGWRSYLEESFRNNRPWNQMARDMVLARSTDSSDVRGGWFLHERRNDHQAIAEVVAPNFFGIRIECAQCHDHPLASEIQQGHYWGLVAFFSRSENKNTPAAHVCWKMQWVAF